MYSANIFYMNVFTVQLYCSGGLVFGIVNIVGNFGTVFCDQAYWQSSVAAKPLQVHQYGYGYTYIVSMTCIRVMC